MRRHPRAIGILLFVALGAAATPAAAQPPENPPLETTSPEPPQIEAEPPRVDVEQPARGFPQQVFRIGGNYVLRAGDSAREVGIVNGDATIDGEIFGDLTVVVGHARLGRTAVVHGTFALIGGSASIDGGARVDRDLVAIGGQVDAPGEFSPGGGHIVVGPQLLGGRLEALVPWVTQGLLWGRLIVPGIGWIWSIVALVFLAAFVVNLVFERPVRACADTLSDRPLSAFLVGLLVLLLAGPVLLLLAVSLVGIVVVPFAICALLLAAVLGRVGVTRWIGMRVAPEDSDVPAARRGQAVRSFVIGFAVLCVAYAIPVLGLVTWSAVGVLGLGAAALAVMSGYRGENPVARVVPTAPPPVPFAPPISSPAEVVQAPSPALSLAADTSFPAAAVVETAPALEQTVVNPQSPISGPPHTYVSETRPPAPALGSLAAFPRASLRDRLMSSALDVVLVVLAVALLDLGSEVSRRMFLLLLAYFVGFWTWKGTTVGGIVCELRVVRVTGEPLRFSDALVRGLSAILSIVALGLGFLVIRKDPERQAWHDRIAGTYVVKVPRNYPL